eukprot:4305344-Prymnesium_polylepis.2
MRAANATAGRGCKPHAHGSPPVAAARALSRAHELALAERGGRGDDNHLGQRVERAQPQLLVLGVVEMAVEVVRLWDQHP